jgi:hypothetical protein
MTPEQALSVLAQASAQARLTAQEHAMVQQALTVIQGLLTEDEAMVGDQGEDNG